MFKKKFLYLVLVLCVPFVSGAQAGSELFARANGLYKQEKYQAAAQLYEQLLADGATASKVYYNLGNAYYRTGEYPKALLNYERARKLAPADEDIAVNIGFAAEHITDQITPVQEFFLDRWWKSVILFLPSGTFAALGVTGVIAGFTLLAIYLFVAEVRWKKIAFYSGLLVIISGLLFVFLAGRQTSYLERTDTGIVFAGTVNVKSGPKDSFKTLFVIHEGLKVDILGRADGWLEVGLPNGNRGWIPAASVEVI